MIHAWSFPSFIDSDRDLDVSNSRSVFDEINQHLDAIHQRFQKLLNFTSSKFEDKSFISTGSTDWKILDSIEANCTTTTNNNTMNNSTTRRTLQRNRRKFLRPTKTITCVKELNKDGKRQIYKEVNVTDDKGNVLSHSQVYQLFSLNQSNNGTRETQEKKLLAFSN